MVGNYVQQLEKAEKRGAGALERGKTREPIVKEQRRSAKQIQNHSI